MQTTMKILHLGSWSSYHIKRFARSQLRLGYDVHILTSNRENAPEEGITVHSYDSQKNALQKILSIRHTIKQIKPDILHSHYLSYGGWLGFLSGFHPHVTSIWGSDLLEEPNWKLVYKLRAQLVIKSADAVLAVSDHLKEEAIKLTGRTERLKTLTWGVDMTVFHPPEISSREIRSRLGLSPDCFLAFSPRSLESIYNHHFILQAWAHFIEQFPNSKLLMIEQPEKKDYFALLKDMIKNLKLESHVTWLKKLSETEMADHYQACDVLLSTPWTDGTPMTVLEGMACGIPVIATDLPSLRAWMSPLENGFLVNPNDHSAILNALCDLRQLDPQKLSSISENNFVKIKTFAEQKQCLMQFDEVYRDLL